jgi:hypothetical protein
LLSVEENINTIRNDKSIKSVEKITSVLLIIIKLFEKNRQLLAVVLDYLLLLSKSDLNPEERVRRRTGKLRHIISSMVIDGIKAGELKKIKVKSAHDYLYSFVEAAIFQLIVLKRKNLDEIKEAIVLAVKQLEVGR